MTGEELKQFIKDQGWSNVEAMKELRLTKTRFYDQLKKDEIDGPLSLAVQLLADFKKCP